MNRKQFSKLGIIVIACMGALMGWAISSGNTVFAAILPIIGALVVFVLQLFKRRVTEVFEDERTYRIGEKASRTSLQTFVIISVVTGLILMVLGQYKMAYTLTFSAIGLSMSYVAFYGYYSKKYGG